MAGKCCGTCRYHVKDDYAQDFVCVNDRSENSADWTEFDHACDEHEEME